MSLGFFSSARKLHKSRTWLSYPVIITLVFQPATSRALGTVEAKSLSENVSRTVSTADIALQPGGVLQGQVVTGAGVGEAQVEVRLTRGRNNWQTKSDVNGAFRISNLPGGTYQLQLGNQQQLIRVWSVGTAPPSAKQGVLFAPNTAVFRGQHTVSPNTNQYFRVLKQRLSDPLIASGFVLTAVAIPVAIHNADDDPPATP